MIRRLDISAKPIINHAFYPTLHSLMLAFLPPYFNKQSYCIYEEKYHQQCGYNKLD